VLSAAVLVLVRVIVLGDGFPSPYRIFDYEYDYRCAEHAHEHRCAEHDRSSDLRKSTVSSPGEEAPTRSESASIFSVFMRLRAG
jgi:hypothetical protein